MAVFQPGRLVTSTAGRDRGALFLVYRLSEDGYVWVVDGDKRPVEKPKKKNPKHLKVHERMATELAERWARGQEVTNQEVREAVEELARGLEEAG